MSLPNVFILFGKTMSSAPTHTSVARRFGFRRFSNMVCARIIKTINLSGNKHIESGMSSEKSGAESDAVSTKISKESVNLEYANRSVKNMNSWSENRLKSNGRSGLHDKNIEFDDLKPVLANNKNSSRRSVRSSNSRYRDTNLQEGSSSYHYATPPRHQYAELVQNTNDLEVEDDRDELLRKLDELKDQIVRSRDKSKEKNPMHQQQQHISSYIEPSHYPNMHYKSHPLLPSSDQAQVFSDPFGSENRRRNPGIPYEQNPCHLYYPGQYISNEMTDNRLFHHPSCTCLVCYNKHQQELLVLQNDPSFYHNDYNPRFSNLSLNSHPSGNEIRRPPRAMLATGGRLCRPVAGGSPFVACFKCNELLQVPKNNTKKMRCAACSEVMLLSIVNKRLILSVFTETSTDSRKSKYEKKTSRDAKWGGTEFSSEDYDNSGNYDFESMDKLPLRGPNSTSYKSTLSYTSEDEIKDAAAASEIDISSNEYVNTETSLESGDATRETDQQQGNVEHEKVNVTINGHSIPDRLVRKAEKFAGAVQPGDYWYDPKAGFWGIMGGPCRGIIPPFIEEFNYPMPDKCADGNTNVFVNGRELHQRDFDLLVIRGLPDDTHRSYAVEISGRVLDEDSGQQLQGLGKLAPTVELKRYGFGMKPPRTTVV